MVYIAGPNDLVLIAGFILYDAPENPDNIVRVKWGRATGPLEVAFDTLEICYTVNDGPEIITTLRFEPDGRTVVLSEVLSVALGPERPTAAA
jgi:hypothetical protein